MVFLPLAFRIELEMTDAILCTPSPAVRVSGFVSVDPIPESTQSRSFRIGTGVLAARRAGFFLLLILACVGLPGSVGSVARSEQRNAVKAVPGAERGTAEVPRDERFPFGLVYFAGTVERIVDGAAIVDLGAVHSLKPGDQIALFRLRDGQFVPLGTLEVAEVTATWIQSDVPRKFAVEIGDFGIFVKSVAELGTSTAIRDRTVSRLKVMQGYRNGYSTLTNMARSEALIEMMRQQKNWVARNQLIAGSIRGESLQHVRRPREAVLLKQIDLFRELDRAGRPATEAAGPEWVSVMAVLREPVADGVAAGAVQKAPGAAPAGEPDIESKKGRISVLDVRQAVERQLFSRRSEERVVASALCATLLLEESLNEPQWLRLKLAQTQFPQLSDDDQYIAEIAEVLRKLRERL